MKIPSVEEWPKELVEAFNDTIIYTFGRVTLYAKHLEQQEYNIND